MSIDQLRTSAVAESATASTSCEHGRRSFAGLVLVSILGSLVATGTTAGIFLDPSTFRPTSSKTDAGQIDTQGAEQVSAITELRRLSALTWEQIAVLFGVSRRAVHFWATGKPMAAAHDQHLQRTLNSIRTVDRGDGPSNRSALFAQTGSGIAAFDLLVQHQYEAFVALLGGPSGGPRTSTKPTRVSADRLPMSPRAIANAREDSAHCEAGPPRRANVVRTPRAG